jgi:hypothetical protein
MAGSMLLNPGQKISQAREQRILGVVAPLVAKGCTMDEVAAAVGYSRSMAGKDMELVRQWWEEAAAQTSERWRGTCLGRHEHLYREALVGWEESKRAGTPNGKMLDVAGRQLEAIGKLLGLAVDITMVQNNVHVGAAAETVSALAPLDVEAYAAMLENGSLGALNSVPPITADASGTTRTPSPHGDEAE